MSTYGEYCDCALNTCDCDGTCGGTATVNDCNVCVGGNTDYSSNGFTLKFVKENRII